MCPSATTADPISRMLRLGRPDTDIEEFQYAGHREFVSRVATAEVAGRTIVASGDRGNAMHFWDLDTRERLR